MSIFLILYTVFTFIIIPFITPFFGRVKIEDTYRIKAHSFFTKILNRNYVTKELHESLTDISLRINKLYPSVKIIYLDANFPFIDKFSLLPHLSHNDGKKIDISFIYENSNGQITNLKPSRSGYGIFEEPLKNEINQTNICKNNNYWQYDFTKYLSFGKKNRNLKISTAANIDLINIIVSNQNVSKIFIEPHLKERMELTNSKIKFHGCHAVRHDDHIHFQVK